MLAHCWERRLLSCLFQMHGTQTLPSHTTLFIVITLLCFQNVFFLFLYHHPLSLSISSDYFFLPYPLLRTSSLYLHLFLFLHSPTHSHEYVSCGVATGHSNPMDMPGRGMYDERDSGIARSGRWPSIVYEHTQQGGVCVPVMFSFPNGSKHLLDLLCYVNVWTDHTSHAWFDCSSSPFHWCK